MKHYCIPSLKCNGDGRENGQQESYMFVEKSKVQQVHYKINNLQMKNHLMDIGILELEGKCFISLKNDKVDDTNEDDEDDEDDEKYDWWKVEGFEG